MGVPEPNASQLHDMAEEEESRSSCKQRAEKTIQEERNDQQKGSNFEGVVAVAVDCIQRSRPMLASDSKCMDQGTRVAVWI